MDFRNAPSKEKLRILAEMMKMVIDAVEGKQLQKALKRQLVHRSSLLRIVSTWISTVPVSAFLAAMFYVVLRGMVVP